MYLMCHKVKHQLANKGHEELVHTQRLLVAAGSYGDEGLIHIFSVVTLVDRVEDIFRGSHYMEIKEANRYRAILDRSRICSTCRSRTRDLLAKKFMW
jgi:hypothetical protein